MKFERKPDEVLVTLSPKELNELMLILGYASAAADQRERDQGSDYPLAPSIREFVISVRDAMNKAGL